MKAFETAAGIIPSERQILFQDMEFYALIYYGMNTFKQTDIGDGFAVPATFSPEVIDTDSWIETIKDGGMKGVMLTAKHYDGFCSWQTETTDYSVKNSNWINGDGDLVKMVADSCRKFSMPFGLYIPVWDRHEKSFKSKDGEFNNFFLSQLKELLTNYGKIFSVILDDRCDDIMQFDFNYKTVYSTIRELQPDCTITFRGPDARRLGNNRGVTRKSEWSVVPASYGYSEDGSVPDSKIHPKTNIMEMDIGSRSFIKKETEFIWSPCEVIYPMRSHLFYKKDDEYTVKTKDKILDIYYRTVGNNANLVLGITPDKHGKLHENDINILKATGHDLSVIFGYNLLKDGKVTASSELSKLYKTENVISDDNESYWRPDDKDKEPEIIINFDKPEMFDKIILKEHIANGQHVEEFTVYCDVKGKWKKFDKSETIGHKKICTGKPVESQRVKVVFEKYRQFIEISYIQIN